MVENIYLGEINSFSHEVHVPFFCMSFYSYYSSILTGQDINTGQLAHTPGFDRPFPSV